MDTATSNVLLINNLRRALREIVEQSASLPRRTGNELIARGIIIAIRQIADEALTASYDIDYNPEDECIMHLDGNPRNNSPENLRVVTRAENL